MDWDYLGDGVEAVCFWYLDEEVEYGVVLVVDADDVVVSGFGLHGVADDLVLVVCAAECDAWCAFLVE